MAYEQNATMLLIKNRLEVQPKETTHQKLIASHICAVDTKKSKLLNKLNAINAKAHGVQSIEPSIESSMESVSGSEQEEPFRRNAERNTVKTSSLHVQSRIENDMDITMFIHTIY